MTTTRVVGAGPSAGESSTAGRVVGRLEYGKFCLPSGAIERDAEHRQLAWSPGFPRELVSSCEPSLVGVTFGELDDVPDGDGRHGSVLRPVVVRGLGPLPVLCVEGSRRELTPGSRERRYTVARYVVAPSGGVSPSEMLAAAGGVPLGGLTSGEAARGIAELPIPAGGREPEAGLVRAFLADAVVYALSGVPIAVRGPIDEETFYGLVSALWRVLPEAARPLVSAGWGVSGSLASVLGVSCATHPARESAEYCPQEGRWLVPAEALIWESGGARREPFDPARVAPGRHYARILGEARKDVHGEERFARRLGLFHLSERPDLSDSAMVSALRSVGLSAFDESWLESFAVWLAEGPTGEEEGGAVPSLGALTYAESRRRAVSASVEAAVGARPGRGDAFLWSALGSGRAPEVRGLLETLDGRGARRGRLLAALRVGEDLAVLAALGEACAAAESGPLPEGARGVLGPVLDEGIPRLAGERASVHARLLAGGEAPEQYREWVKGRRFELALALAGCADTSAPAAIAALGESGDPQARAVARWAAEGAPDALDLEAIEALGEERRVRFAEAVAARWVRAGSGASRRVPLVGWVRALRPDHGLDVALALALHPEALGTRDAGALADAVEGGAIPASLIPDAAAVALRLWFQVKPRIAVAYDAAWKPLVALWPADAASALLGSSAPGEAAPVAPQAAAEAAIVRFPAERLARVTVDSWLSRGEGRKLAAVAPRLWSWAVHSRPSGGPRPVSVDLCRWLAEGELPDANAPADVDLEHAVRLARAADVVADLRASLDVLWSRARRAWHLRLLLALFPAEDLVPSADQVAIAAGDRVWLRLHVVSDGVVRSRRKRFRVALADFHGLDSRGADAGLWLEEFAGTAVWAAFAGLPVARQGSLREALLAYREDADERSQLCLTYLRAHEQTDAAGAARRVLEDFLLPQLGQRMTPNEITRLAKAVRDQATGRERSWWRITGLRPRVQMSERWERILLWELMTVAGAKVVLETIGDLCVGRAR